MPARRRRAPGQALGESRGRAPGPPTLSESSPAVSPGGVTRVLVDGRNVQRALERGSPRGSMPTAALVAQLRAAFSLPVEVELILDGHPGPTPIGRIAPGFSVVFSRGTTADHVIGERVVEAFRELGAVDADSVLVVSDDREVRYQARRNGVRVQGTAWLAGHLAAAAAGQAARGASIGQGRAPKAASGTSIGQGRPPRTSRTSRTSRERR